MVIERRPQSNRSGDIEERNSRELASTEVDNRVFGQGSYEKVTSAYPAHRAVLDGVAAKAEAYNQGIVQIGGFVYHGEARNGYLFIEGNADVLFARDSGRIYLKKDRLFRGERHDKEKLNSGNVRQLFIQDYGSAIVEGDADEVTVVRGAHVSVSGDVKRLRVEEAGEVTVQGKIGQREIIPGDGYIRVLDGSNTVLDERGKAPEENK
jgi:hypothetical protein